MQQLQITEEQINRFFAGHDPMKRIVAIECDYQDSKASIIFVDDNGNKRVRKEDFKPFVWAKNSACIRMFGGDRDKIKRKLQEYGIGVKALITHFDGQQIHERIDKGYKYMFFAKKAMPYGKFLHFFEEAGVPIYGKGKNGSKSEEYLAVSPVEQHMIATGKRLFKGYDAYDDCKRMVFDLETEGLDPKIHAINQIGVRINHGRRMIISVEGTGEQRLDNELMAIIKFVQFIHDEQPDIVIGHNSENFDWNFIIERCKILGTTLEEVSRMFFAHPIYKKKKPSILKLGGEMEYYYPTVMWGFSIIDSLQGARRAQATNSQMALTNLKYLADFFHVKRDNRVYVKGNKIGTIWLDNEPHYAFNDTDGTYYLMDDEHPLKEGYEPQTGRYIVERYLLDDLEETDKIEVILNEANFQVCKILPTSFSRACTMGTAGIWKLIMCAWSYEHDLAIPAFAPKKRFVGGLSRLLKVGVLPKCFKADYAALYPTTTLNFSVKTSLDITNGMLLMLDNRLSNRNMYKGLKKNAEIAIEELNDQLKEDSLPKEKIEEIKKELEVQERAFSVNDKIQSSAKVICNSFFGSYGSCNIFPWGDLECAEKITCIGRMMLRVMIYYFSNISKEFGYGKEYDYIPVVGDSFTGDTPLFIKYNDTGFIDIKPIEELIDNNNISVDGLGREYDYSKKNYKVLCRSGWVEPNYIYRHKTDKDIYEVTDGDIRVEVTEDHSLFDDKQRKIKPSEITSETRLEMYSEPLSHKMTMPTERSIRIMANWLVNGVDDRVPTSILNATPRLKKLFLSLVEGTDWSQRSKTCQAGILFLKNTTKE